MNLKTYDLWLTGYKNTEEEYKALVLSAPTDAAHALIDLHHNLKAATVYIETLEGRVYELEALLGGRDLDEAELADRASWAWPEKEED